MPNDFVNTVTASNGTTYDIYDKRLNVTAADVGKVVSVDEEGNLVLKKRALYQHVIKGWAIVNKNQFEVTILIVGTFSEPFTGISGGRLVGGGPWKQIISMQLIDVGGLPSGLKRSMLPGELKPLEYNPDVSLWAYDGDAYAFSVTPSFSTDTVTELES